MNKFLALSAILLLSWLAPVVHAQALLKDGVDDQFLALLSPAPDAQQAQLNLIEESWQESYLPMALEILRFSRSGALNAALLGLMVSKTGQSFGFELTKWDQWMWNRPEQKHPSYADFKSKLYRLLDPHFEDYFNDDPASKIRLDEIAWGGVAQDGIPPLRSPAMISAKEASYLEDDNLIFGISINGDHRAYPKRILAWHEMFVDEVGDTPVAGVYCTLCGTVILYKTNHENQQHQLGTSGFLYRSNKLMYDKATQSMWSTFKGEPVVGPLVGKGIKLAKLSVVTSTWGEWRRRHPDTKVLSLQTGYKRDYSEGTAYKDYFSTDHLMFKVPKLDTRLRNKDEIFGVILEQHPNQPLAISADFLTDHVLYHDQIDDTRFVVLTDTSGANRMYEAKMHTFQRWDQDSRLFEKDDSEWLVTEDQLISPTGEILKRLPAYRAFWFGWISIYPNARLVSQN